MRNSIEQANENLVGNALRHTPAGGTITLSATQADGVAVPPIAELTETKLTKLKVGNAGDPLSGVWAWTSKSG